MGSKGFRVLAVLLVLIIVFCVKGTVMSKEKHERAGRNRYYAALEQEYEEKVRCLLAEEGYEHCGVNMRRVTYETGRREYTVQLHHRRLEYLQEEERAALEHRLSEMEFESGTCRFIYE